MFWGAGFLVLFFTSFLLSLVEYTLSRRVVSGLSVIVPDMEVDYGKTLEIRYESPGLHVLPGCIVKICIEFFWHERILEGCSVYSSRSRHGLISLSAVRRGEFSSPGAFYQVSDAAGFFRFRVNSRHEEYLVVKPDIVNELDMPRIQTRGGEVRSRTTRKMRSDELIETRQYYPGDDVRRINWKTFAHLGEIFIRQGEELPDPESRLTIIPDLSGVSLTSACPAEKDYYLDYLVSVLSGVIEGFRGSGVSLEILLPGGRRVDGRTPDFLPGMWWNDSPPDLPVSGRRVSSYLLICSPFSNQASKICRQISTTGTPVSAVVPVPPVKPPAKKSGRLAGMIFTPEVSGERFSRNFEDEAETLVAKLKAENGGINAVII